MNEILPPIHQVVEVREAFDEQALKREWDEAAADEQDAMERKVAVLRKALTRWPMIHRRNPQGALTSLMIYSPEMRRFVRDVLGMPDTKNGGMNEYARVLLNLGVECTRARSNAANTRRNNQLRQLRAAVVELTTKYRLGADPQKCMEELDNFYRGLTTSGQG